MDTKALFTLLDTLAKALALTPDEKAEIAAKRATAQAAAKAKRAAQVATLHAEVVDLDRTRQDIEAELATATSVADKARLRREYNELGQLYAKYNGQAQALLHPQPAQPVHTTHGPRYGHHRSKPIGPARLGRWYA